MSDRLQQVVRGDHAQVPPVLTNLWAALDLGLRAAAPGQWIDAVILADCAAGLVDARPGLADEMLQAAVAAGTVQRHHTDHDLVRLTPPPTPGRPRERSTHKNRRQR